MKEDVKCEELNPTEYLTADEFWDYEASINKLRRLAIDESGRPEM